MSLLFDPIAQKGSQTILMDNNEEASDLHKIKTHISHYAQEITYISYLFPLLKRFCLNNIYYYIYLSNDFMGIRGIKFSSSYIIPYFHFQVYQRVRDKNRHLDDELDLLMGSDIVRSG
jgi:hypothetical protein